MSPRAASALPRTAVTSCRSVTTLDACTSPGKSSTKALGDLVAAVEPAPCPCSSGGASGSHDDGRLASASSALRASHSSFPSAPEAEVRNAASSSAISSSESSSFCLARFKLACCALALLRLALSPSSPFGASVDPPSPTARERISLRAAS
eukprot:7383564-Prymnesium_polylepis.1